MRPMELKAWVEGERGRALRLARDICVPPSFISKMVARSKAVPIERCVPIERATNGQVTRRDLRPDDWHEIWPELANQDAEPITTAHAGPERRVTHNPPHPDLKHCEPEAARLAGQGV